MKFVKATAEEITCPPGTKEHYEWDDSVPGLGMRAYPSGKKVWVARYRSADGRHRKLTLGDASNMPLEKARKAGQDALAAARLGDDPAGAKAKARTRIRVIDLVKAYIEKKGPELAPAWLAAVKRHLETQAKPLHHEIAETVHRREIVRLLDGVKRDNGKVASNRLRSTLSAMWTWGMKSGLVDAPANPVAATPLPAGPEKARERVLTDTELALIWQCTAAGGAHDRIVRLLMLTGARKSEISGGMWPEIILDNGGQSGLWTVPTERSKNGLAHEIPLGPLAIEQLPDRVKGRAVMFQAVLENSPNQIKDLTPRPFSGWSTGKKRLDAKMLKAMREAAPDGDEVKLNPWTLHDLRRTFATRNSDNGIEPHIVEALLNHVSGPARRGVAGVYNRSHYRTQKRAALLAWEAHIRQLVGLELPASNVVQMAKQA